MSPDILSSRFLLSFIQLYFFLLYISVTTSLFLLPYDKHLLPLDHRHTTVEALQLKRLIPIVENATIPCSQLPFSLHLCRFSTSGAELRDVCPLLPIAGTAKTRTNAWNKCHSIPDSWTLTLDPRGTQCMHISRKTSAWFLVINSIPLATEKFGWSPIWGNIIS